jgi:hypothetical protein
MCEGWIKEHRGGNFDKIPKTRFLLAEKENFEDRFQAFIWAKMKEPSQQIAGSIQVNVLPALGAAPWLKSGCFCIWP